MADSDSRVLDSALTSGNNAGEGIALRFRRSLSRGAASAAAGWPVASGDDSSVDSSSGGAGDDVKKREDPAFRLSAAAPIHRRVRDSPLSAPEIFKQSHAGLFNLCIVVLIAVNGRLILENLKKYGLLMSAGFWINDKSLRDWPLLICCLTLPVFPLVAFIIEKLALENTISDKVANYLHAIVATTEVAYPAVLILKCDCTVLSGFILMFLAIIVWMKLVSLAHTNSEIRKAVKGIQKDNKQFGSSDIDYSQTLTLGRLLYFMMAPTLCYQPSYPRTASVRKGLLIRQIIQCFLFTGLMGFIIEQYVNPIVKTSKHPLKGDILNAIESVLKLSLPNVYVWLCMFYCFFHLWLNILAEILQFGDREFYKDWWNAKSIDEYWRMWNMPVHRWMVRHFYFPCLRNGLSKETAVLASFFLSAVFHELCVAIPCHIFRFWAFLGILFQFPLIVLTKHLHSKYRDTMGNMIFWFFFCILGQPMCVLLYYHDVMNRKEWAG